VHTCCTRTKPSSGNGSTTPPRRARRFPAASLEKISATEFRAVTKIKIGPVSARFRGKVHLSDIDAPNFYRTTGEGDVAGFAKGGAAITLVDADAGGTRLG
jgi:carbon monoxide dehydrogenase subunit G